MRMPVILCSPYAASAKSDRATNDRYLKACMLDSLGRGEAPLASHALWTQFLDDNDHESRQMGLDCEHTWLAHAAYVVVYIDLGISSGMALAIAKAESFARPMHVERRSIPNWPAAVPA